MSRYVPAKSRAPASPEYVAVPGYMGQYSSTYGAWTEGQKKLASWGIVATAAFLVWRTVTKK